jgi:hypothetical protein
MAVDALYTLHSDAPHYSILVEIEDAIYALRFFFNSRDGYWYLSVLDDSETTTHRAARRVIPFGSWLEVDEEDRLSLAELRALYDLAGGFFRGSIVAVSTRALRGEMTDADYMRIEYVTADSFTAATERAAAA